MQRVKYLWVLLILGVVSSFGETKAQVYQEIDGINFVKNSKVLSAPLTGGINNAQVSMADLNFDNEQDIVLFDRMGNFVMTFLRNAATNTFTYAPTYASTFPEMTDWMLMRDFNCDGIMDIFTHQPDNRVKVYQGQPGSTLTFTKIIDTLRYSNNGNQEDFFIISIDIPGIADVNGDGDLDFLTFANGGGYMLYMENRSQELSANCGLEAFELLDECWGNFYESGLVKSVDLDSCGVLLHGDPGNLPEKEMHAGSTVMIFDSNGDGLKEVVLGDVAFDNLNMLINGGTLADAHITAQDTAFPTNQPVALQSFPAAFYEDISGDGIPDLLVAPNATNISGDVQNLWYYENTGSNSNPAFSFIQNDFLTGEMVDVGTLSIPVLVDYNGDGLQDLVISNRSRRVNDVFYYSSLTLYHNNGTIDTPAFIFVTDDLFNLSQFMFEGIHPTFGDLDGDGDMDLVIGESSGLIHYFPNTAGSGNPISLGGIQPAFSGIQDVGSFASPQLVDVNLDGLLDLIVGEKTGNLNYFENSGTATSPDFPATPTNGFLGLVNVKPFLATEGFSVPYLFKPSPGAPYELLVGNVQGRIYHYTNIENNLSGTFTLQTDNYANIQVGGQATVSGGMLNGDSKPELVIGNLRGGLNIYSRDFFSGMPVKTEQQLRIFPNPGTNVLHLHLTEPEATIHYQVFDVTGKKVMGGKTTGSINIADLTPGLYLIKIRSGNQYRVTQFLKQ